MCIVCLELFSAILCKEVDIIFGHHVAYMYIQNYVHKYVVVFHILCSHFFT